MPSCRSPDEDSQPEDLEGCAGGPGFADKPEGSTWVSETKVSWKGRLWVEGSDHRLQNVGQVESELREVDKCKRAVVGRAPETRCGQYTMALLLPLLSVSRNENTLG